MERIILLLVSLTFFQLSTFGQENRTFDGSENNLQYPNWNATHSQLKRLTTTAYADGIAAPAGTTRPNPRIISNALFAQDSSLSDPRNLSDFVWVFGQFIDHDLSLTADSNEPAMIQVPAGDPWFDPFGQGTALIFMSRSEVMDGTGTDVNNPRQHGNEITAWLDASNVYGSDLERANWLRTFENGKMRMSSQRLLPFNTFDSNYTTTVDYGAPAMDDAVGISNYHFVAGDPRANENPLLASFHTLFVREHNRLCDTLLAVHPDWTDEETYQHARKMVGGLIQNVVYSEWLPSMGVEISEYTGYDASVDPRILNVFSAAAFRMGHTLLNSTLLRLDNEGNEIPAGHLSLQEAFFNPLSMIWSGGGVDPLFKGMGTQVGQDMDCKVIDDVRNFLFGPPGAGGLDLASININRGRERGLPDFNTIRADFGLVPYTSFEELNSDLVVANSMEQLYGDINDIDPWVGMLAEEHMTDALFGETIMKIMEYQFAALRDGDRFYFENDAALSAEEILEIKNTNLHDILMRNTNITLMQDNVFEAMPHEDICNPTENSLLAGTITNEEGETIELVNVLLENGAGMTTTGLGTFDLGFSNCEEHTVTLSRNDHTGNGVSTFDMVLIQKHILTLEPFTSPYEKIAADVNRSKTITTFDLVQIRQVILGLIPEFPSSPSWLFLEEGFTFDDPNNPFETTLPNNVYTFSGEDDISNMNFMAIKIGDVNNSAMTNLTNTNVETRTDGTLTFAVENKAFKAGEKVDVYLSATDAIDLTGLQFTLNFDNEILEFIDLDAEMLNDFSGGNFAIFEERGALTVSYNGDFNISEEEKMEEKPSVFHLSFLAKNAGTLENLLQIDSRITAAEAYTSEKELLDIDLNFIGTKEVTSADYSAFKLYQNQPNPFHASTEIRFFLPEASKVQLQVFDLSGKVMTTIENNFEGGMQTLQLDEKDFDGTGVFYYQLQTAYGTLTKKLIRI